MAFGTRPPADSDDDRLTARLGQLDLDAGRFGWVPGGGLSSTGRSEPSETQPAARDDVATPADVAAPTMPGLLRAELVERSPLWLRHWMQRAQPGNVLTALVVVAALLIGGAALWRHHAAAAAPSYSTSRTTSTAPPASATPAATTAAGSIVVDVTGQVRKPGLVTLPIGARVQDAVAAAGGFRHRREAAAVNLAARVVDGQQLIVGGANSAAAGPGSEPPGLATTTSPGAPISLSTASLAELETLPGVGPVTAQKIVDWRTAHSGFSSIEQLQQVSGIGPATYAELAPLVTP
ncbi:MAG TPA: helix-hairpin-helix domain-containing protein [Mycobacteriales bacterium]|nr:helix-hairpin-helix domain-containing protein [Mycobacteriales bacterium]